MKSGNVTDSLKPSKTVDESFEIPSSGLSLSDTG
jgi:hypothetical protein